MGRRGYQQYLYKGWQVRASEYYGDWEVQPYWKDDIDGKKWENFCNNECIRFDTLKEAKAWVGTPEAKEIKDKYYNI